MARPRKPKPMNWHVFVGRRGIDVPTWLQATGLRSYDDVVAWCKDENVVPPAQDELKGKFTSKSKPAVVVIPVLPVDEADEAVVDTLMKKAQEPAPEPTKLTKKGKKASKVPSESSK